MDAVDVTIVGGGIVGCATAAACARRGLSTVLLEREEGLGRGITSRNSEVAHGGMYYPAGSRKARCCVQGRRLLKEFCAGAGVAYRECGKLIVATDDDEVPELERLLERGRANGVEDLQLLDALAVARLEPEVRAVAALWSPRTGILDAEGAAKAYGAAAARHGAQVLTGCEVRGLDRSDGQWQVFVGEAGARKREGWTHPSRFVVNCAGLGADAVAAVAGLDVDALGWRQIPVKGNYFRIAARHAGRVGRLVYPVPPRDHSSLGVHLCLDLAGGLRLGPDVEGKSLDSAGGLNYDVDPGRGGAFFAGAVRFLPWLRPEDLSPDMAGYRPKLAVDAFRDFVLDEGAGDTAGLINLVGIDSPGLTSAAALAEDVARLLG
jgi:L-2-hydroxyglutarate oxidase LhgO